MCNDLEHWHSKVIENIYIEKGRDGFLGSYLNQPIFLRFKVKKCENTFVQAPPHPLTEIHFFIYIPLQLEQGYRIN